MPVPQRLNNRYEIKQILGQGGMGIVYRAYDVVVKRDVALKTIRDLPNRAALQMFQRECEVLAAMSHPNIIEIFDIGEFEEEGKSKPYFVMALLSGLTLDKLIRTSSQRLTVERTVEIMIQTCRGLQAAHERGLVHRDMKPSNIFVMDDDSVKIIDFGVAHMIDTRASMGAKGTLLYMSPEQLQLKPPSAASDLFSLGVVCWEAFTRRRPFERSTEAEIIEAILHQAPPPASTFNPAISQALSRVVHKAMAKEPWHRYSSAREFAETLQKALRNEPIEFFDPARIQPRIERAQRAYEQNDFQFASEILTELEAEGHLETAITMLRRQIDQAMRLRTINQLLDSARTRFDHEEYPLALQKIQEVLQLDPANATGLSLKSSIEYKLTTQKIEDWFRLARQHIDNHSWGHAREAAQNVLSIKPKDTHALQLLAEVDRLEQEYVRVRREKEQLFQAALEAWQDGEVSAAVSKLEAVFDLDQKAPDTTSPDRAAAYRNLYNQVRSEHDFIKNSYAEARQHLAERKFAEALAVCSECLAKHPGHALFQALKYDIAEQQRQELSARIAGVDRQVEAETDLDRRVAILESALSACPEESHFERALRPARDKRDLVNSIVAKARYHEERGQFTEALAQWEILGTIYSQYPGLSFETERVIKRREQQSRSQAKVRLIEQIDRCLQTGDYRGALDLLGQAEREFPNDPELASLGEVARQAASRTTEAQQLLSQGRELCAQQRFEEGLQALRRAAQLDERNPLIRAALVDVLVEQARVLLDSDWRTTEGLILEALELEPGHSAARSLRTLAQDRKRDELVAQAFSQARELRASGDLESALAQAEQCLAAYPGEPRLTQLRDILTRELQESRETRRRQARRADLEELRRLEREAAAIGDVAVVRSSLARAQEVAQQYPGDPEMQSVVTDLERRLAMLSTVRKPEPPPVPAAEVRPPLPLETLPQPIPVPLVPAESPGPVSSPAPAPKPPPRPSSRLPLVLAAAGGLAAVALVVVGVLALRRTSPGPHLVAVQIQTSPSGASVLIDNQARGVSDLKLELPAGKHEVEARLEGYQPARTSFEVAPGLTAPVRLTLEPVAPSVRLITDLETGKVVLDDQPARELQEGELTVDALAVGKHTLKLVARDGEATISFDVTPAAAPSLTDPVTKNLAALVVVNLGSRARLHASFGPAPVELDGQPVGQVGPGGLELGNLAPGTHELVVGADKQRRKMVIEAGPAPTLTAFLQSDREVGGLVVLTGDSDVRVFLNGREQRRPTSRGQLRIPSLAVREYSVRVAKEGFLEEAEQRVQIRKGEEAKLEFKLRPAPMLAALAINGGPAGAQVLLDQNPVGTVQPDGSFHHAGVAPGDHAIELRLDKFQPKRLQRAFAAGQTVQLLAGDLALDRILGRLQINVTPREAQLTLSRAGEAARPITGTSLDLPEGVYAVQARAPDHADGSATVQIVAGQTQTVKLDLTRLKKAPVAPGAIPAGMEAWSGAWKQEGGWFLHRGGNFVLYQKTPTLGRFVLTAMLREGRRLKWVLNYTDAKNYDLFEIDKRSFYHTLVRNGRKTERPRVAHNLGDWQYCNLSIEVSAGSIIHRAQRGQEWLTLSQTMGDYGQGQFGFYLPGGDEVGLSNFTFTPKN
ncbi:MAG: protein kinase [Acidobacteriota bacterium]